MIFPLSRHETVKNEGVYRKDLIGQQIGSYVSCHINGIRETIIGFELDRCSGIGPVMKFSVQLRHPDSEDGHLKAPSS